MATYKLLCAAEQYDRNSIFSRDIWWKSLISNFNGISKMEYAIPREIQCVSSYDPRFNMDKHD